MYCKIKFLHIEHIPNYVMLMLIIIIKKCNKLNKLLHQNTKYMYV